MTQFNRLTWIYHLVLEKKRFRREDVVAKFPISEATFKRDLEYLRNYYNVPIVWDAGEKHYCYDANQNVVPSIPLPEIWFNQDELTALILAYRVLAAVQFETKTDAIQKLKERIKSILGHDLLIGDELKRIEVTRFGARRMLIPSLKDFVDALLFRKRMQIEYHSRHKNQTTSREISPQRLIYHRDNWYLVSWCHAQNEIRSFSVDRIQKHSCSELAAHDVDDADLDRELSSGYGIYSGSHVQQAHLKFSEVTARWVADQEWHAEQEGWHEDGNYHLQIPYTDERELLGEILRFGADVEVVSPLALRERVLEVARTLVGRG